MQEQTPMKKVNLYTAGACSGDPGPGGWGLILEFNGHRKELSGFIAGTTQSRMQLFAVISGLGALKEACEVTVCSEDTVLVTAFTENLPEEWKRNVWKTADGKAVMNSDLWFILSALTKKHQVRFVQGKASPEQTEILRCRELARLAIEDYRRINPDLCGAGSENTAPSTHG